ncbi:unnamed protein product, partial [Adineta steineri]
ISFNQPVFSAYAAWDNVGITFANSSTVGTSPYGIFVDTNNTVYVANKANNQIQVWLSGSTIPARNITSGVTSPYSIFATITGDIYVDNGYTNNRVDKWVSNRNISSPVMQVQGACYDLFIDVNNTLYCSLYTQNQVAIKSLNGNSSMWIVAAGMECSGSTSNTLTNPRGIFVDTNLNLYVADCGNDRVQLFLSGQVTATTVAGSTAAGTISLDCPSDVALDGGGYLFIVDSNNNRIIGSGPNGFRCIIACASTSGSASNQLSSPSTFSFDSYGNIYVTDQGNSRVQKFMSIPNTTYPLSFNQPNFCPSTTWYTDAVTFASSNIAGSGIFVSINNTVYVANQPNNAIYVFLEGSSVPNRNLTGGLSGPFAIYATLYGDVYVDNGGNSQINKWGINASSSVNVMTVNNHCEGLFIDISNTLYCSITHSHQVVKKWLNDNGTTFTIVAGTGSSGSAANQLYLPSGLYVDAQYNVYVTDCGNNRVQFFPSGQIIGITKVGSGATGTITLNCPHAITFDANSYMFITDWLNNRVIGSGPYGFRCLFGCTTTAGSSSSQLNSPISFGFDSYGNLFVSDSNNNRVQKFIIASNSCSLSYSQPTFCSSALWSANAVTLVSSSIVGLLPYGIFINGINTVYVPNRVSNTILTWPQWSTTYTTNSYSNLSNPFSLFMSITGDIYIDNGYSYGRVDKYIFNTSNHVTVMNINGSCYGLFVDINNNLYCSLKNLHQVVKLSPNNGTTIPTIAAGNGSAGSLSNMLNSPQGIYVDSNSNLYVADCANNRIQFVQTGQLNGVAIVGNGSSANITLNYPTGIVLDANGYLFIVDSYNHRIVASSSTGFRCIVGCFGGGSSASQLSFPQSMAFDSYGNIYVTDRNNSRVQQFTLQTNNCSKLFQYRPPPLLLLRAAAAVPPLALLLLLPVPQVALLLLLPVPQVALPLAVLLRAVAVPRAAVPQVALPLAVLLRAVAVPQAAALQVALLPRPPLAAVLLLPPPQVQQQVAAAAPQVVILRAAAAAPQVAPLLPLVLQQVAAVPQVVLPRAAVVPQVALLPQPPLAVLQQAVAPLQVAAVLQVLLPLAVLQVALLPRPPLAVLLLPPPPQVLLLPPPPQVLLQAVPQVVLLRAAVAPQVAPLQTAAVLQVLLLPLPLLVLQQVAAVVVQVAPLLLLLLLQQVAVVPQVALLP